MVLLPKVCRCHALIFFGKLRLPALIAPAAIALNLSSSSIAAAEQSELPAVPFSLLPWATETIGSRGGTTVPGRPCGFTKGGPLVDLYLTIALLGGPVTVGSLP
eukprot:GHVT01051992.1.p1 GENE.GHVT01051992.1~~GHVT01051992.1.p1  ORF type:complete len:104 (-),score=1.96 GHVT01051992.1:261-572(-)